MTVAEASHIQRCRIAYSTNRWSASSLLRLLMMVVTFLTRCLAATSTCSPELYRYIVAESDDIPERMIAGSKLRICQSPWTCCTPNMEASLIERTEADFDLLLADKLSTARHAFVSGTARLDALFIDTLNTSRYDLEDSFAQKYADLYSRNSRMFSDLFNDLKRYYKGGEINLSDSIKGLFGKLMLRLFERHLVASGKTFRPDPDYVDCFDDQIERMQPVFDDLPRRLVQVVRQSFAAARSFAAGLRTGRDTLVSVSKFQASDSCRDSMVGMLYCSLCRGLVTTMSDDDTVSVHPVKPCNGYCRDVMTECFSHFVQLNDVWNDFLKELLKMASKFEDLSNFDRITLAIRHRMSQAVAGFRSESEVIVSKVLSACGEPLARDQQRRTGRDTSVESGGWANVRRSNHAGRRPVHRSTTIASLVRELRGRLELSRDLFDHLPESMCDDMLQTSTLSKCWNGRQLVTVSYNNRSSGGALFAAGTDVTQAEKNRIRERILQLRFATGQLANSYYDIESNLGDSFGGIDDVDGGSGSAHDANDDDVTWCTTSTVTHSLQSLPSAAPCCMLNCADVMMVVMTMMVACASGKVNEYSNGFK